MMGHGFGDLFMTWHDMREARRPASGFYCIEDGVFGVALDKSFIYEELLQAWC